MFEIKDLYEKLADQDSPCGIVICAEPGSGRSRVVTQLLSAAREDGREVSRRSYGGISADVATTRLVSFAREVDVSNLHPVVGVDDLPPSDEPCVVRQARALNRILDSGSSYVLSIVPEACQLLEMLHGFMVLYPGDLFVRPSSSSLLSCGEQDFFDLTRGIPSLSWALDASGNLTGGLDISVSYVDALSSLVGFSLRPGLTDESLRLRLAMLLLGSGTQAELERVLGSNPDELLRRLRHLAPLFGISDDLSGFSCLETKQQDAIALGGQSVMTTCGFFPDVAFSCARLLYEQGRLSRSAKICGIRSIEGALDLVLERGCDYLDAGEVGVVMRAIERRGLLSEGAANRERVSSLGRAGALVAHRGVVGSSLGNIELELVEAQGRRRDALLFAESRLILRGCYPRANVDAGMPSELCSRLVVHRGVCALLMEGRFGEALTHLMGNPAADDENSVSSALLALDLEFVRMLLGEMPERGADEEERCPDLFKAPHAEGLAGYKLCVDLVRASICGDSTAADLAGELIARSEHSGDVMVQIVALVVGSLLDLRAGSATRAGVRAVIAESLARGLGQAYAARVAAVLAGVSRYVVGDSPAMCVLQPSEASDDLDLVCGYLSTSTDLTGEKFEGAVSGEVPRNALWLLLALIECSGGERAKGLREHVPHGWRKALGVMERGWRGGRAAFDPFAWDDGSSCEEDMWGAAEGPGKGALVEVKLLGDFGIRVRGNELHDARMERRGAKSLLEYLLLRRGRTAKRYEIVEQIWPGDDYVGGFRKLYKATSMFRSVIKEATDGFDPFLANRTGKSIALDCKLIRCDVDEFERCAREAVDAMDDARALGFARRAELLYAGDLCIPATDGAGYFEARQIALRGEFVDAMVAGADAALRLGQKHTAVRFATQAISTDDMREDAVGVMVAALSASGRKLEADQQNRRYGRRLSARGDRSPKLLKRPAEKDPLLPASDE